MKSAARVSEIAAVGNLEAAFAHKADDSGVFEAGQNPIIVGQAAYNSAYGTNFVSNNWCNAPKFPSVTCDGFARISEQGGDIFNFDTLLGSKIGVRITSYNVCYTKLLRAAVCIFIFVFYAY